MKTKKKTVRLKPLEKGESIVLPCGVKLSVNFIGYWTGLVTFDTDADVVESSNGHHRFCIAPESIDPLITVLRRAKKVLKQK